MLKRIFNKHNIILASVIAFFWLIFFMAYTYNEDLTKITMCFAGIWFVHIHIFDRMSEFFKDCDNENTTEEECDHTWIIEVDTHGAKNLKCIHCGRRKAYENL